MSIKVAGTSYTHASKQIKDFLISQNYWSQMNDDFKLEAYYRLKPEPTNAYDKNAIRVEVWLAKANQWIKIGYIPKSASQEKISKLVNKKQVEGYVNIFKKLPNYAFIIK